MSELGQGVTGRPRDEARRQERAYRILDAAATLILRWGYNKTTIDDIAKQARVAKGTIYLHWKTREELFVALLHRERVALLEDLQRRIAEDPGGATLRGMMRHSALALMQRPLLKAVLLRDMDVLGKLAHHEQSTTAYTERLAGFKTYLEVLREHGLVRTDLSLNAQLYILSATFMGFFLVAPMAPDELTLSDEEVAELLAETVHRTLEPASVLPMQDGQTASDALEQYLHQDLATTQAQVRQGWEVSAGE